jgi:hypothetical protein
MVPTGATLYSREADGSIQQGTCYNLVIDVYLTHSAPHAAASIPPPFRLSPSARAVLCSVVQVRGRTHVTCDLPGMEPLLCHGGRGSVVGRL